ncbi:hypothetical protein [Rhizobium sp. R693]|uniref:hypothetical protein n=1 Tax=Rhizobium sp. R693 TaxID=1764276 RepID=UPI000B5366DF|nr:hypothetical protein [Rhizobium sp. R693]OWV91572.1 hypothetical protein ATY79_28210 [Rhizobium sp. R693]
MTAYPLSGVYSIVCKPTGDKWVGSSDDIIRCLRDHFACLADGVHVWHVQRLYDLHSPSAFECYLIVEIEDEEQRLDAEQHFLDTGKFSLNIDKNARKLEPRPKGLPLYRPTNINPRKIEIG